SDIECHGCLSSITRGWVRPAHPARELVKFSKCGKRSSEALAKPSSDPSEITVSSCPDVPRVPRFDMLEVSVLGVDQQPCGHRKGRGLGFCGQPAEAERTADAHRYAENLGGEFRHAGKLGGAAAQNDPSLRLGREGRILQAIPDHLENLLSALPDDVRDR